MEVVGERERSKVVFELVHFTCRVKAEGESGVDIWEGPTSGLQRDLDEIE